ncbi:hypothetical protein LguiB_026070 [Lonicera macranthoides]
MGEALFELEQILRSKHHREKLTSQEANVLMTCKGRAIREFTIGAGVGGCISWLGTAIFSGLWRFGQSLDSCIERILGMEGTRIQKELATIMLKKYRDDPMTIKLVSKHFYSERVYDESSSDQPKLRWRYRNASGDNIAHSGSTKESDTYGEQQTSSEKTNLEPKQVPIRSSGGGGDDASSNPFDCIFGSPLQIEEIRRPGSSGTPPKKHSRSRKRSHRRHQMRNGKDSENPLHT